MTDPCREFEPLQSAWLDGQLEAPERERLGAHLTSCEACRDEVDSLARVRAQFRSVPVRQVPLGLFIAPEPFLPPEATRVRKVIGRAAAAVAVLAGLLGGAAFGLGGQPEPAAQVVRVPVDAFAVEHLVRTIGLP